MAIKMRRLIVIVPVATILLLANFMALSQGLDSTGVIEWARSFNAKYITGTAITVIAALLILMPSSPRSARAPFISRSRCPVCNEELRPGGRYCAACGSRI